MKRTIACLFAFVAVAALSACNTVSGIGKDVEKGGEAIQRAVNK